MINRPSNQDLERIAKLSADYLAALRGMPPRIPRITALLARNLVLDIFASEREFIRTFQGLIDAGLREPTAKSWDLAIHCKHDWGYKTMSSKVIKNFDDGWKSNNLLLATRVMQCIGEWKELSIEPVWDSRIADHINLHNAIPSIKVSNRASETSKNSLNASDDKFNGAKPCSDQNTKATANTRSFGTNVNIEAALQWLAIERTQITKSKCDSIYLWSFTFIVSMALGGLSYIYIPLVFSMLEGVFSEAPLVRLSKIDATREVKIRLASYHYDLTNARLVCELDKVTKQFKSLEQEVRASYAPEAANLVKPGIAKAMQRISFLKQPGKKPYWEDCSTGVGYQMYDQYSWSQNESFYGSLFAVAKRKCVEPAIQVITYADAGRTKALYSQWVNFKPDPWTGVASRIKFTVPMGVLPSGYSPNIWIDVTDVRCN